MTNEIVPNVMTPEIAASIRQYTVASNAAIPKGSLLVLSDPQTAALATVGNTPCAGISSMEKENNDYSTTISAWTQGDFRAKASGAISAGAPVSMGGSVNEIMLANTGTSFASSGARTIGYSKEAPGSGDTFVFRLNL